LVERGLGFYNDSGPNRDGEIDGSSESSLPPVEEVCFSTKVIFLLTFIWSLVFFFLFPFFFFFFAALKRNLRRSTPPLLDKNNN
jgi:hypothetical protein